MDPALFFFFWCNQFKICLSILQAEKRVSTRLRTFGFGERQGVQAHLASTGSLVPVWIGLALVHIISPPFCCLRPLRVNLLLPLFSSLPEKVLISAVQEHVWHSVAV